MCILRSPLHNYYLNYRPKRSVNINSKRERNPDPTYLSFLSGYRKHLYLIVRPNLDVACLK